MCNDSALVSRFLEKIGAHDENGCQPWTASVDEWGYGRFRVHGKNRHAHRIAWEIANSQSAGGWVVRHRCDNPICVNPEHLELGTVADNNRDTVIRGRHTPVRGPRSKKSRLTEEQVRAIRASTLGTSALGRMYGITPQSVHSIRIGKNWAWLT